MRLHTLLAFPLFYAAVPSSGVAARIQKRQLGDLDQPILIGAVRMDQPDAGSLLGSVRPSTVDLDDEPLLAGAKPHSGTTRPSTVDSDSKDEPLLGGAVTLPDTTRPSVSDPDEPLLVGAIPHSGATPTSMGSSDDEPLLPGAKSPSVAESGIDEPLLAGPSPMQTVDDAPLLSGDDDSNEGQILEGTKPIKATKPLAESLLAGASIGNLLSQYSGVVPVDALAAIAKTVTPLLGHTVTKQLISTTIKNAVQPLADIDFTPDVIDAVKSLSDCIGLAVTERDLEKKCYSSDSLGSELTLLNHELLDVYTGFRNKFSAAQASDVSNVFNHYLSHGSITGLNAHSTLSSILDALDALAHLDSIHRSDLPTYSNWSKLQTALDKLLQDHLKLSLKKRSGVLTNLEPIANQYRGVLPASLLANIHNIIHPLVSPSNSESLLNPISISPVINDVVYSYGDKVATPALPAVGSLVRCLATAVTKGKTGTPCYSMPDKFVNSDLLKLKLELQDALITVHLSVQDHRAVSNIVKYTLDSALARNNDGKELERSQVLSKIVTIVLHYRNELSGLLSKIKKDDEAEKMSQRMTEVENMWKAIQSYGEASKKLRYR